MLCGLYLLKLIALEFSDFKSHKSFQFDQVSIKAHFTLQTNILNPSLIRQIVLLKTFILLRKIINSSLDCLLTWFFFLMSNDSATERLCKIYLLWDIFLSWVLLFRAPAFYIMLAKDINFKICSFHPHLFCTPKRKDKSIGCLNTLVLLHVFVKTALSHKC